MNHKWEFEINPDGNLHIAVAYCKLCGLHTSTFSGKTRGKAKSNVQTRLKDYSAKCGTVETLKIAKKPKKKRRLKKEGDFSIC